MAVVDDDELVADGPVEPTPLLPDPEVVVDVLVPEGALVTLPHPESKPRPKSSTVNARMHSPHITDEPAR